MIPYIGNFSRSFLFCRVHDLPEIAKKKKTAKKKPYYISSLRVIEIAKIRLGEHLRFCQTPIMWHWSLSAILPLFWRHDIANTPTFAATTWKVLLWRHVIHNIFPRNLAYSQQNLQFCHHFTKKFNIFSLILTGDSNFLILFISTQYKLSMNGF